MAGIRAPNLPTAGLIDKLLGISTVDGASSTRLISIDDMANQMLGDGPISDTLAAALDVPIYSTLTGMPLLRVPAVTLMLQVQGYSAPGDFGSVVYYKRAASQPSHPGRFRTLDRYVAGGAINNTNGGWWEICGSEIPIEAFGDVAAAFHTCLQNALICAAAIGAKVVGRPGVTYVADGGALITDLPVRLDMRGAKVNRLASIEANDLPVLDVMHTHGAVAVVTALSQTSLSLGGAAAASITAATLGAGQVAALGIAAGDMIKIVSDDLIPWGTGAVDNERLAEIIEVYSVVGDVINFRRRLRVPLVTNIRLAKMKKLPVEIDNAWFNDVPTSPLTTNTPLFRVTGAVRPIIRNAECDFGRTLFIDLISCIEPESHDLLAQNLRTDSDTYFSYGYGLREIGCVDGLHYGLSGRRLRHAYTTGASTVATANNPDLFKYGGTIGSNIHFGVSEECDSAGFDTHPDAAFVTFYNCKSMGQNRGFLGSMIAANLRGWKNKIKGMEIHGNSAISAGITGTGGDFELDDVTFYRPVTGSTIELFIFDGTGASPKPKIDMNNIRVVADEQTGTCIRATSCDLEIGRIKLNSAYAGASSGNLVNCTDSDATIDHAIIDLRRSTGTAFRVVRNNTAGNKVLVKKCDIQMPSGVGVNLGDHTSTDNSIIFIDVDVSGGTLITAGGGFANRPAGSVGYAQNLSIDRIAKKDAIDVRANAAATLTILSADTQYLNVALTATRAITEATVGLAPGREVKFVRGPLATGDFAWSIGSDALNFADTWLVRKWDGTAWFTVAASKNIDSDDLIDTRTNADATLTNFSGRGQSLNVALTAARTITEPTDCKAGTEFKYFRGASATGAFNWIIGSDNLAAANTWLVRKYNGSSWVTIAKGSL